MERFWSKVRRGADDECWEWTGSLNALGYGVFTWSPTPYAPLKAYAHRVAWELTHGEIPEGLVVRHRCRGKCVNPNHLELGTQAENCADMIRDGTSLKGGRNPFAVLTKDDVRRIKQRLTTPYHGLGRELAKEFNVSPSCITDIRKGRAWSWI